MLQFPLSVPPGAEIPPPTLFDQFCGFLVLYMWALALIGFLLPRPVFVALFRIAFPFMPERLEDFDEKN